jgi:serine/threonine protein kinase
MTFSKGPLVTTVTAATTVATVTTATTVATVATATTITTVNSLHCHSRQATAAIVTFPILDLLLGSELYRICYEMAKGVQHLHNSGFIHHDIALRNFVVSTETERRILLTDFGKSGRARPKVCSTVCSRLYCMLKAPHFVLVQTFCKSNTYLSRRLSCTFKISS